jgi:hypothetical protein
MYSIMYNKTEITKYNSMLSINSYKFWHQSAIFREPIQVNTSPTCQSKYCHHENITEILEYTNKFDKKISILLWHQS